MESSDFSGVTLGQYEIVEEIGSGGMATVYRGVQQSIGREVAVKVLRKTLIAQDETFLDRFYREVEVIANLQHPHILPVYDFGQHDGQPFIVMAYLRGGSLSDWISNGPMELGNVMRIVMQVADALDYAHSRGIIHRDFKPSNVMLDEQHNTYLADFGLAKVSDAAVQLTGSKIMGTPDYMAPDLKDATGITPLIDVYALGVTLFQMLTGHVPFESSTPMGVLMAHLSQPVPDVRKERPDLPGALRQVVATAMSKTAEGRYSNAGLLYEALKTAVEENAAALVFANMRGQVIFVNERLLRLLKLSEREARGIIGETLHTVLGIDQKTADQYLKDVNRFGHLSVQAVELRSGNGEVIRASLRGSATFDDEGNFIGADFALQPKEDPGTADTIHPGSAEVELATSENTHLELYFGSQLQGLRTLLVSAGGPRFGTNLERIINETAERNGWPVHLSDNEPEIEYRIRETHIYHALLSKAAAYASNVMGPKLVEKQMRSVDDKMDVESLKLAGRLGLRDIFIDRI